MLPRNCARLFSIEYRLLLSVARYRLPKWAEFFLFKLRRGLRRMTNGDWRTLLGDTALIGRRQAAIGEINEQPCSLAEMRLTDSWHAEEWVAMGMINGRYAFGSSPAKIDPGQTIWLTAHYASSIAGAAVLGQSGKTINAIGSNVVNHPSLPRPIQEYYARKYAMLEANFNGGKVIAFESGMRDIYRGLAQGHDLIVVGDLPPPTPEKAIVVSFFGKKRAFAPGAVELAIKHRLPLQPFYVIERGGQLILHTGPRVTIVDFDDAIPAYRFLLQAIETEPSLWWAADLLPALPLHKA